MAFADVHIHLRYGRFPQVKKMLDDMASIGVTDACLLALPYRSISENLSALYWKFNYDKMKIAAFGGLHSTDRYSEIPYEIQAEKLLNLGCDGIKFIEMCPSVRKYMGYGLNDAKYDKMFSMFEERNTPVLIHSNDPVRFWDKPLGEYAEGFMSKEEIYAETFEMLDKHPMLNVTLAHFFFMSTDVEWAGKVLEKYPNVKIDLTPNRDMYFHFTENIEAWHDFFVKYKKRILFGTDSNSIKAINIDMNRFVYKALTEKGELDMFLYPSESPGKYDKVKGLGLDEETVSCICYNNYVDFIGANPQKVNVEKYYEACETVLAEMRKNPIDIIYNEASKYFNNLADDPEQKTATDFFEAVLNNRI